MKQKFIQKNGTGALFLNQKKVKENQPDYTGTITINNEQKQISAWIKVSQSGNKYISVSISEPFPKRQTEPDVELKDFENTQEIFDEGDGEPQQDMGQMPAPDDDEEVPF